MSLSSSYRALREHFRAAEHADVQVVLSLAMLRLPGWVRQTLDARFADGMAAQREAPALALQWGAHLPQCRAAAVARGAVASVLREYQAGVLPRTLHHRDFGGE